ncbi:MAG: hypothetical protein IPO58_03960 [Betaproteobacteria bacterium]|nr:hypothetical protein [Betaproteobacteria bacterium]
MPRSRVVGVMVAISPRPPFGPAARTWNSGTDCDVPAMVAARHATVRFAWRQRAWDAPCVTSARSLAM